MLNTIKNFVFGKQEDEPKKKLYPPLIHFGGFATPLRDRTGRKVIVEKPLEIIDHIGLQEEPKVDIVLQEIEGGIYKLEKCYLKDAIQPFAENPKEQKYFRESPCYHLQYFLFANGQWWETDNWVDFVNYVQFNGKKVEKDYRPKKSKMQ
jgi:hypothetical protein